MKNKIQGFGLLALELFAFGAIGAGLALYRYLL
jgi:hypothetical protein